MKKYWKTKKLQHFYESGGKFASQSVILHIAIRGRWEQRAAPLDPTSRGGHLRPQQGQSGGRRSGGFIQRESAQLSVLSDLVWILLTEKRIFFQKFKKCCNFANFWSWTLRFWQESDLVLKRSNPGSFCDPMIFGTPSVRSLQKIVFNNDQKQGLKFVHFWNAFFQTTDRRGTKKSSDRKNSPDLSVSERDLIPVKFLWKNIEKQKVTAFLRKWGKNSLLRQ